MRIGMNELLVVLAIVVIIFGPKQLPKLSKMLGKTVKNFKEGVAEAVNLQVGDPLRGEINRLYSLMGKVMHFRDGITETQRSQAASVTLLKIPCL